jgi:dTDP-glucose 4,6-dehydratase
LLKLLITGGAGFIGSNFIRFMMARHPDYKIINLDLLTYAGNLANLKGIGKNPNYQFVKGDICDFQLVDSLAPSVDAIINFAAESHVDRSIVDPALFARTNILGTQVLLETARKYNIKKFLQISTDEVYGSLGDTGYFTEETPLSPNSPYSASKASADLFVHAYAQTYDLTINITRCSNNYGPYQFPEKLIPLLVSKALQNQPLPIYGDGSHIRDWLYVTDHCAAIDLVLHQGKSGEIYNIGGHNEWTNYELAKNILSILGKPESLIQFVQDRPGHDRRYAINASKIRQELGWKPQYSFEQGIVETLNWYLQNRNWWM